MSHFTPYPQPHQNIPEQRQSPLFTVTLRASKPKPWGKTTTGTGYHIQRPSLKICHQCPLPTNKKSKHICVTCKTGHQLVLPWSQRDQEPHQTPGCSETPNVPSYITGFCTCVYSEQIPLERQGQAGSSRSPWKLYSKSSSFVNLFSTCLYIVSSFWLAHLSTLVGAPGKFCHYLVILSVCQFSPSAGQKLCI